MKRSIVQLRWLRPASCLALLVAFLAFVGPLADQGPQRPGTLSSPVSRYFAASGEGIIICGICCSGDTACWTRLRTDFERANPPRGRVEGVCWAQQSKWERDPQTGQNVSRTRSPIFTRVRFNEAQVLNSEYHGRNAGFEWEVGRVWSDFVRTTYSAEFPASDGWNWSTSCVSLNSPRHTENQQWDRAQAQATYHRVFMPTYGVADTPEERAAEAKANAERMAREAEQKRAAEAKAAEEARQRAEAEAARKARVDAIARQIGPGKTAAAERLLKMNEEVAALRPKPRPAPAQTASASPTPAPRQCTRRQGTQAVSHVADTRQAAEAGVARSRGVPGGSESIVESRVSGSSCEQRNQLYLKPPPVGTCLSCITEQMAINLFGYVPGKGYPPPKTEWICRATVAFTAERCGSGTSRVTAQ